jgi:hypothetical protein
MSWTQFCAKPSIMAEFSRPVNACRENIYQAANLDKSATRFMAS